MNPWPVVKVSDACELIVDCVNRTAPLASAVTPFKMIRTTNVRNGFIDTDNVRYVDEEAFRRWTRRAVPLPGDVVLTREAPLGEVGIIRKPETVFLGQRTIMYRTDPKKLDSYFLMYSMLSDFMQRQIRSYGSGSTVEHMRLPDCFNLLLQLPPLQYQKKIATILSAYDDLIENNNRRIKILEEMAQRIYREWFADFRYPGHENATLVKSGQDEAPEGWIFGSLRDVVDHHIGGGWGVDDAGGSHDRVARVIRGTDILRVRRGDVSTCPIRYHTAANLRNRLLLEGDIVIEVSGGSKGQPVGRSAMISNTVLKELRMDTICASFCKLVRTNRNILLPELLNYRVLDAYDSREIETYQVQSTGITNLQFSHLLDSFPVLIPPMSIQSAFVNCVGPMLSAVELLGIQVRSLRAARDLLLPRLISGEIDITDLDLAMPEEAAA